MEKLIVFLIFMGFSIVSSLMKSAREKAEQQKPKAQVDPARRQRVQSEIEAFLNEVGGNSGARRAAAPTPSAEVQQADRQRQAQEAKRKREEQARQRAAKKKQRQPTAPSVPERPKPQRTVRAGSLGQPLTSQIGGHRVGGNVSEHVGQYIGRHVEEAIDNDIEEYVEETVIGNVNRNLGRRDLEMPTQTVNSRRTTAAADSVRKMLKDPKGVRNAILVNEILSRPKSLR
ncbi:MAG: hypothetical protein R3C49_13430 [Planctomycetaceae bacterium]